MPISQTVISRVVGINTEYKDFNLGQALYLPQRIIIVGQGNESQTYSTDKKLIISAKDAADKYGYGSPLHLVCRQLFPENRKGLQGIPVTAYPLVDDLSGIAANASIDVSDGPATINSPGGYIKIGGIRSGRISIIPGEAKDVLAQKIKDAIDAVLEMPVTTGPLTGVPPSILPITSKWKGESANQITIDLSEFIAPDFDILYSPNLINGANNPDVQDALDIIGEVWETIIINCMNYDDIATNLIYSTFNEGRWDQITKKPLLVFTGCVDDFATRTAITDSAASKISRTNPLIVAPGCKELPFVIAARALVDDIAQKANDTPAYNYIGILQGLKAGPDEDQEDFNIRDNAVKLGSSTSIKNGELIWLNDTITTYHPDGEPIPAYRYVVDIIKLMNIIFNLDIIQESFKGRPLLPDDIPTNDPYAIQPKSVKATLSVLADNLASGRSAILADPNYTKNNMTVTINGTNPKRLDTIFPVKLSGNVEVNSTDLYFSFYFGQ